MRLAPLLVLLLACSGVPGQELQPEAPRSSLAEAHALIEKGRTADALVLLNQLGTVQPPVKGLNHELGLALYRSGKLTEAQKAFSAAVADNPSDTESVQMLGLTLYRLGKPAEAIPYLKRVRQWTPNANADSNYVLGLCYMHAQQYDEARRAFAEGFAEDPESGAAHLLFGSMLIKANLSEQALAEGKKAQQLAPALPLVHFLLGEAYLAKSDFEHAAAEFEAERRINPGYAPVYDRLGNVYSQSGKLQQAQEALTKAISLDRSSTGPFIQMGKVLLGRGDPATSLMYLKHAEKMDPGNFTTHTLLAQAYHRLGHEDEATEENRLASRIHAETQFTLQPVE